MGSRKQQAKWWQVVLGFILLAGMAVGTFYLVKWLVLIFSGLQKEVAAAIIATVGTILVSVISVTVGKYFERKRSIEQELREKKIPMYNGFVEFLFKVLMADKIGKQMSEKDMMMYFSKFTQELMVWGSDEVVSLWSNCRRHFVREDKVDTSFNNMFELEKLLLAIRKDTGHKNKGLNRGDLLGLFINDIHKYVS